MGRKGRKDPGKLFAFVDALVAHSAREIVGAYGGGADADSRDKAERKAREVGQLIARQICKQFARSILYVPMGLESDLLERDQRIFDQHGVDGPGGVRKYTSARVAQLSAEHNLTVGHIYDIIRFMRPRQASPQARLPGLDDDDSASPGG